MLSVFRRYQHHSPINIYVSWQRQNTTLKENTMIKCAPMIAEAKFDSSILKISGGGDKKNNQFKWSFSMSTFNSSFRENQHDPVLQTSQRTRTTSKCHTAGTNSALNYSKVKTHQIQQYIKLNHCGCQTQNARERIQDAAQRGEGERGNVKRPNEEKGKEENPWIQSAAAVPLEVWMFSPNLLQCFTICISF